VKPATIVPALARWLVALAGSSCVAFVDDPAGFPPGWAPVGKLTDELAFVVVE
jgi:hypothetical protein